MDIQYSYFGYSLIFILVWIVFYILRPDLRRRILLFSLIITPLGPLFTAWCAVNRQTASGRVLGESERISVEAALRAITLGAAYTLHMDHLVGSIEVGKHADIVLLSGDPFDVYSRVEKTIVDGILYYDRAREADDRGSIVRCVNSFNRLEQALAD